MHATETPSITNPERKHRRQLWTVVLIGLGLMLGVAGALGPRLVDDASASDEPTAPTGAVPLASLSTRQVADASDAAAAAIADEETQPDPAGPPAPSPRAAVEGFLAAEAAGNYDASYGALSAADRARAGGRAAWIANHPNLPPIAGFTVTGVVPSEDGATVTTATDLRASLDEIIGLVPAHARGTWVAVPEDGGWRVGYARSRLRPIYPDDAPAAGAARAWVIAAQQCRPAGEWEGGIVGDSRLVRRLCHRAGPVVVGAPSELGDDVGAALPAAFGPEIYGWARRVRVTGPTRLDLILAPVGEQWLVVGVTTTSPGAP